MKVRNELGPFNEDHLTFDDIWASEVFEAIGTARIKTECGGYVHLETGRFVPLDGHSLKKNPVKLLKGEYVVTEEINVRPPQD